MPRRSSFLFWETSDETLRANDGCRWLSKRLHPLAPPLSRLFPNRFARPIRLRRRGQYKAPDRRKSQRRKASLVRAGAFYFSFLLSGSIQQIFFFELSWQIGLGQILKIFVGESVELEF